MHYTKEQILNAAETSLFHRGIGRGPDADAGWEKVWRAAAWAQLANETEFYKELTVSTSGYIMLLMLIQCSTPSRAILRPTSFPCTHLMESSRSMQIWDILPLFW
jgi:hypothetical protein